MGKYRALKKRNKYYIPREDYLTAIHYSLRYPLWKQELDSRADTSKAINYDKDNVITSGDFDPTFEAALKLAESPTARKVALVDAVISQVANGLDYYLRLGVCYGLTFKELKSKDMPCEKTAYYLMRRHYYFVLSQKI